MCSSDLATLGLKKIRLNLARTHEFPNGSNRHGYEFAAPLGADGHIDAAAWKKVRDHCRVRRFWGNEDEDIGHLLHRPGGSWAFHYDIHGDGKGGGGGGSGGVGGGPACKPAGSAARAAGPNRRGR